MRNTSCRGAERSCVKNFLSRESVFSGWIFSWNWMFLRGTRLEEGAKKAEETCDSVTLAFHEGCFETLRYAGNGLDRFLFVAYVFETSKSEIQVSVVDSGREKVKLKISDQSKRL